MLRGCSIRSHSSPETLTEKSEDSRSISDFFPAGCEPSDLGILIEAMAVLFKVLVSFPGLRRAPGAPGRLKSVSSEKWHGQTGRQTGREEKRMMYMTSDRSSFWPVPTTLKIIWDLK